MHIFFLAVLSILFSHMSFATCYTVYDKSDKIVYKSSEPPFDLSTPISEGIQSKYPGGYLIKTESRICYLPEKTNSAGISVNKKIKKRETLGSMNSVNEGIRDRAVKPYAPGTGMWGKTPTGYIEKGSPDWANRATISPKIYGPGGPEDVAAPAPEIPSAAASQRSDGALCPMYLASQPRSSGRGEYAALVLDDLEARLYRDARSGQISWVQLVDRFYSQCAALYQGYYDEDGRDLPAYQRVLAEKMDAGSIKESEWIYLQESKLSERRARHKLIENTRPSPIIIQNSTPIHPPIHRSIDCTTREFGGTYRTTCD